MVVLDIAIVNVALPSIQQDLGIEQSTLQWILIAYGLMLGGFLLLGGRMADLLGRRRMLPTGLTLFSSASLLAGVAGSAGLLIGTRALQGFGAALLPPAALSILAVTFAEGAEHNRALGIYGAVAGISASVGVIASGLLTDGPGWRWVFFINVPVGVLPGRRRSRPPRERTLRRRRRGHRDRRPAPPRLRAQPRRRLRLGFRVDAGTVRRVRGDAVRFRADRSAVPVTAGARLVGAQPHAGGGEPLGVLHVRSGLLLHLPRFAADATGSRLFADADWRRRTRSTPRSG